MAEYNIGFSKMLMNAADAVATEDFSDIDVVRTVLYLSSLASEITLKALLERAGIPVEDIKSLRHSLSRLFAVLGKCQVQAAVTTGARTWVPAIQLCAKVVDNRYSDATVGKLITGEECGASKYPNELRYGDHVRDYPPELKMGAAKAVIDWVEEHWSEIRITPRNP